MEPRQFPAELVGGPKDGEHWTVTRPWFDIAQRRAVDMLALIDKPPEEVKLRIGRYEARMQDGRYVRTYEGWYLFDWKGWG